jgi:hypothetical protein
MLDHGRAIVMAGAGFGERKCSGAKGALRRHPADQPVSPATAGAVIDLMLTIDGMIAAALGIVLEPELSEGRETGHDNNILSEAFNGMAAGKVP